MAKGTFDVINKLGLHARAAATLVKETNRFESEVFLIRDGNEVNGKSIMGVLTLAAAQGTSVEVRCEGSDAQAALSAIEAVFRSGFGED
ncbi:MAG: HPr family phosphocarrier protein [Deltaproteobacteria bacterium]|nr:HPr family phosphocarrier protein [Deltaproteobacteria bacterium]